MELVQKALSIPGLLRKKVGFTIDETMSGTHHFVGRGYPKGDFPFHFTLTWGGDDLLAFINPLSGQRFCTGEAKGTVTVGRFIDEAECRGTIELRYFTEAKIRYSFEFSKGRKKYHYVGEKIDIRPWNLHRTHTTCYGTLYEVKSGKEVSRSITYFKLNTLVPFLMSFRLTQGGSVGRA